MKASWAEDHKIQKFLPNPYPRRELIHWFYKELFGLSRKNKNIVTWLPHQVVLNDIQPRFRIGFVGDVMEMKRYDLQFDTQVIDFFADVALVVGNFEATLTTMPKWVMNQRHNLEIMDQLRTLTSPQKILLNYSNNHSGDFAFANFNYSIDRMAWAGYNAFGRRDIPNFMLGPNCNIVSGTMWINQHDCSYITRFEDRDRYFIDEPRMCNIFYPHWGYEYELWPRKRLVKLGNYLLQTWDIVFGHHPHVPQAVTSVKAEELNKLLVFSGGNFTSGLNHTRHNYGIVLKCEIGPSLANPQKMAVGKVDWHFSFSEKQNPAETEHPLMVVKLTDNVPFFK